MVTAVIFLQAANYACIRIFLQAGIIDEMMGDMMDSAVDADLEEETEEEVDKASAPLLSCIPGGHWFGRVPGDSGGHL